VQVDRKKLLQRWEQLKLERSSWIPHYQEISENLMPRSGRFFVQDRNRGQKRHNTIYDSTGTRSLGVLSAGMMGGNTSPARPWFRLATSDPELMRTAAVKVWLSDVSTLMHTIFQRSNTYRALHTIYEELGAFGTAASIVLPDFENVIHHYPLTVGEYAIATNWKGEVDTLYREFEKTVGEMVQEFGPENVSPRVKNMFDRGQLGQWVPIIHAIEPRAARDTSKASAKEMPWRSIYFEAGGSETKALRESGFRRFPALCPRWAVDGGDIYGRSPGMEALGDLKQLQHAQLRKAMGIDYKTMPPLQAPTSFKGQEVNMLPGGLSYVDAVGPANSIRSAFDASIDLSHLLDDIQDVRGRVRSAFFADIFLMLANQTDARMTATEVAERHEEKMLMLGPVIERLKNELLDPLIEITFDAIMAAGIAPPPPEELQGTDINVELVSMLAQAQRAIGTNSIDRFTGNLAAVAQFKPNVLDKFDEDQWADIYAEAQGIDPRLVVPNDKANEIRQARAQAAQAAAQAEQANIAADTAQKLAGARTDQPSALTDATAAFSGYT
jgi:hypothetical protein